MSKSKTAPSAALSRLLDRAAILGASDVQSERVEVPEWGGHVYVRAMTGTDRDAWEQMLVKDGKSNVDNARAKLVVVSTVDEDGNRLFAVEDVELLGRKSGAALTRIAAVAQRLSKLSVADLEEAVKN